MLSPSRSVILILLLILQYLTLRSDPGWIQVPSGTTEDLHTIRFFDADTGWAASRRRLFKTCDGGLTWQSTVMDSANRTYDVFLFSLDRGISVKSLYSYVRGCVLGTTNGGIAWDTLLYLGPEYGFNSIFFLDDQVGWISGIWSDLINYHSFTVKTTDSGTTWSSPGGWCGAQIYSLFFLDFNQGFAAGYQLDWNHYERLILMATSNGGVTWGWTTGIPWLFGELKSVYFSDSSAGYTVGHMEDTLTYNNRACVFKSTDGGVSWELIFFDQKLDGDMFNDVYFASADTGWVISDRGRIMRTDNGGNRWRFQDSLVSSSLNDIFFLDENTGWIAGDDGIILKTTSGGVTGIEKNHEEPLKIPKSIQLYQNYPNPFNSGTEISFYLPEREPVTLEVFNIVGQKVATPLKDELLLGQQTVYYQGENLTSGVYFYQLRVGKQSLHRKMVVLK